MKSYSIAALAATLALASAAQAGNLVKNGGFESNGGNGQIGFNTTLADWSVPAPPNSYAFLFSPGVIATSGVNGQFGFVGLWGPGAGVNNGLAPSPAGGFAVATDPTFQPGALSQTITGLKPGAKYTVGFWYAFAQQLGFDGATTDRWQVSLGGETQSTADANLPSHGFSGWTHQDFTFTADGTSDVLSFLSTGSPAVPPFALLDGVTMTADAPEPAVWAMMTLGLFGLGLVVRRQRRRQAALA